MTGKGYNVERISKRIFTLERLFNIREGYNRSHDALPIRTTNEPLPCGRLKGNKVVLDDLLDNYYPIRKWDSEGIPTKKCLKDLGLEKEIDGLQAMGLNLTG